MSESCFRAVRRGVVASCAVCIGLAGARAGVMMQGFYKDVPSPAAGTSTAPWWWDNMVTKANSLATSGFSAIWIPPVLKGASGGYSNGYDPFDDYDIGSKNQMSTATTRYGTREQLEKAVATLRSDGLDVYLDMVENHRNGDPGNFSFLYKDAYGNASGGRFQKGQCDFHYSPCNIPQDPDVPNDDSSFGRDLAPINGSGHWIYDGLNASGDWLTKALDIQGYRLDYVKGISYDWLKPFLNYGAMAGKFAVGEYYDSNRDTLNWWSSTAMGGRASAFDFSLRDQIKGMCNGNGFYDMTQLDHAGLTGINPGAAVTFVENHDTDGSDPITANKMLGYALILTSEGYPCVFYKDYSTDAGCYGLKTGIDNLIWIHEKLASGTTTQRWKDSDVFAYERMSGNHLLVGLNDNTSSTRTVTVATGFGNNIQLHDYTGHGADVWTNGTGQATITIPKDTNGGGYVCYSKTGVSGGFTPTQKSVKQEYAGAPDLDIQPADNVNVVTVGRIYVQTGKPITCALYWDATGWTSTTKITTWIYRPDGTQLTSKDYTSAIAQGTTFSGTAATTGWFTLKVKSYNTPAGNLKPKFWLDATYTAPQ